MFAYSFVPENHMEYGTVGVIANNFAEATQIINAKTGNRIRDAILKDANQEQVHWLNVGFAVMKPAIIQHRVNYDGYAETKSEGYFAFLDGMFFAKYQNREKIAGCRHTETSYGHYAQIYGDSHSIYLSK